MVLAACVVSSCCQRDAGAMYFLYLQLGLASLIAITVLILLMPLQASLLQILIIATTALEPSSAATLR